MTTRPVSRAVAALLLGVTAATAACTPPEDGPVALDDTATVTGADNNGDGVRDDIEEIIAKLDVSSTMREHLTATMRVEQNIMALDTTSGDAPTAAYELATAANELISCPPEGVELTDANDQAQNLRMLMANTPEREAQIEAFAALINGRAFGAPTC